jgi:hypothetical protein
MSNEPPLVVLPEQPVLILEVPREIADNAADATVSYFQQDAAILEKSGMMSHSRWRFIGKFMLICTAPEQVSQTAPMSPNFCLFSF